MTLKGEGKEKGGRQARKKKKEQLGSSVLSKDRGVLGALVVTHPIKNRSRFTGKNKLGTGETSYY